MKAEQITKRCDDFPPLRKAPAKRRPQEAAKAAGERMKGGLTKEGISRHLDREAQTRLDRRRDYRALAALAP